MERPSKRGKFTSIKTSVLERLDLGDVPGAIALVLGHDPDPITVKKLFDQIRETMRSMERFYRPDWESEVRTVTDQHPPGSDDDARLLEEMLAAPIVDRFKRWNAASQEKKGGIRDPALRGALRAVHPMTEVYRTFIAPDDTWETAHEAGRQRLRDVLDNPIEIKPALADLYLEIATVFLGMIEEQLQSWEAKYGNMPHIPGCHADRGLNLKSALLYKLQAALRLVTGRRPEGIVRSTFEMVEGDEFRMRVTNIPKKDSSETWVIPVLAPAPIILRGIELYRQHGMPNLSKQRVIHDTELFRFGKVFASQKAGGPKEILVPLDEGKRDLLRGATHPPSMDYNFVRGLYARLAYARFGNGGDETIFIHQALCHAPKVAMDPCRAYEKIRIG
jgi:hypothetical protein